MRFNSKDYNLIQSIVRMDSEGLNMALGDTRFIEVMNIGFIGKFFGINLKDIDDEFQELKDTKYKYDEFCDLCDEGKENEEKLLSDVFEYVEIQRFSEMIINKVDIIYNPSENIINKIMTFAEATQKWGLADSTLRKLVATDKLQEGIDYRKSGKVWLITEEAMKRIYGEEKINGELRETYNI